MSDPTKPKFTRGIRIKPDNLPLENVNGEIKVDSVDNKIKTTLGGSAKEIITNDQTQTLTNKTIDADNNTVSNLEVDNLKTGVLNVDLSTGIPTDTQLPSAKAVKDYVDAKTDAQNEASEISFDPAGTIAATNVQAMGEELDGDIQAHINNTVGAHAASAISNTPAGNLAATDVQGALNELQSDVDTRATQTALDNHINDTTDAHDASAISVIPTGNLAADDVQEALEELQTDIDTINVDIPDFVKGPAISGDDYIPVFSGSTGKLIKSSGAYIDSSNGLLNLPAGTSNLGGTQIIGNKITGIGGSLQIEGAGPSGVVYINNKLSVANKLTIGGIENTTSTGSNVTLPNPNTGYIRLKNSGLVSIDMIDATSSNGQKLIIENLTGNPITINNKTGATAANQIVTGSGRPLTLLNEASIELLYDGGTNSKWQVIGGTGSGEGEGIGGADILFAQTFENADLADFTETGLSLDTVSPLHNEVSAKLTHQASVNQSFKQVIPVDPKFRGQINQISLQVKSAASAGNVTLNIYDETNAANILASEQLLLSNDVSGIRNVFSFTIPSTCASLSYTITALPEAGSPVTLVDDIVIQLESVTLITEALVQESDTYIRLNGFSSLASSTTQGVRLSSVLSSIGSSVTYEDSASFGATFNILEEGTYDINAIIRRGGGTEYGECYITVNQTSNVTISTDTPPSVLARASVASNTQDIISSTASTQVYLFVGDKVRVQLRRFVGTSVVDNFTISKAGTLKQVNVNPNSKITIPTSELRMEGASTRGSTATTIVRFDNVAKIRGDAFEVVSNAVDGTYVRMKKAGKLDVSVSLVLTTAGNGLAITKNQSTLTTLPTVASESLASSDASIGGVRTSCSTEVYVSVGDIIRISSSSAIASNVSNNLNLSFQEQDIQVSVSNTLPQFSESDSSVRVDTANGYGSTATKIRRFSNIRDNIGTDIEYVDSATNGASFTVKSAGIYNISYSDSYTSGTYFGLSKNSAELTTNIVTIATASRLVIGTTDGTSGYPETVSWSGYLQAGDVIRAHSEGNATGIADRAQFTISKVGKPNVTGVDVTPFLDIEINKGMIGEIVPFAGQIDTQYFLECDGRAISRSSYSDLFSKIGTNYGQGDGSTTFNLPDYRGQFLRGRIAIANVTGSGTASSNQATFTNHGFNRTGLRVRLASGTLSGLTTSTNYYVIVVDANTLAFATTRANALANTRIAISGTNTAVIQQWEDVDASTRQASNVGGNTGTNVGSIQEDAIQNVTAYFSSASDVSILRGGDSASGALAIAGGGRSYIRGYQSAGASNGDLSFDASRVARTSNETRPSNVAVNYGIRYRSNISHIITPTESFSTDTAQLTYAPSTTYTLATLANAPVGTYITFTYAANTNTRTQTTTRPTQTDADMNVNGIQLYPRAYTATSTAASPAAIAINIGKGFKGRSIDLYKTAGKVTPGVLDFTYISSTKFGAQISYNENTGILFIDVGESSSIGTSAAFIFSDVTTQNNGYLVINASKSPSLVGVPQLLPRIATLSDVKPSGTAGGTATAGAYQTRTLNTIDDPTGIVTSLAGNQWVLQAGEYYIEAEANGSAVASHKIKIRNITDSSDAIIGNSAFTAAATTYTTPASLKGKVTINSAKTFELQHRVSSTKASDGFGVAAGFGDTEIHSVVKITRVR